MHNKIEEKEAYLGAPKGKMYVGTLQPMEIDNELLVQLFQSSLTGPMLTWLMNTDPNTIHTWSDLASAFMTHYAYNTYTQLPRRKLELVKQGPTKCFTDFIT